MDGSPKTALLIFVKYPEPGKVKTRLAASNGAEKAAAVYRIFAQTCLQRYQTVPDTDCIVYFAPAEEKESITQWFGDGYIYETQPDGDLGERLKIGFKQALKTYSIVIALGTDSPDLPVAYIGQAVAALKQNAVVIGPSEDGGYYLIGMNADHTSLFDDIAWSTGEVLNQTIAKAKENNLSVSLLPEWYDIDTEADLLRLMASGSELKNTLQEILDQ